jgi:hypothetical protein
MPSVFCAEQVAQPANRISLSNTDLGHSSPSIYGQDDATISDHEADNSSFPTATSSMLPSDNFPNYFRRGPTLPYNTSGRNICDFSRQRDSRWLVLVLPPALLIQENKKLGRTLASGSSTRLSQGVLMPLFPTVNMNLKYRSGTITDSASDVRSAHGHCP